MNIKIKNHVRDEVVFTAKDGVDKKGVIDKITTETTVFETKITYEVSFMDYGRPMSCEVDASTMTEIQ